MIYTINGNYTYLNLYFVGFLGINVHVYTSLLQRSPPKDIKNQHDRKVVLLSCTPNKFILGQILPKLREKTVHWLH